MESRVLYRKYRPQRFAEIIGQEHVVKTLSNAIASGNISQSYLFCGPHGTGKTTMARLLAKAVNCESRGEGQAEPCNQCPSCQEMMEGRAIDLIEIDAASHRGIDEVRELKDAIKFVPTKSKYKVFILDEAHQLSKDAANALLKTLEEPPSHSIFILATTEAHKMIPTIISRCQRFDFRKLTLAEIIKRLEMLCLAEGVKAERPALEIIALQARGAIRDGESLLDQALTLAGSLRELKVRDIKNFLGLVETTTLSQLADFLCQKKAKEAVNFLNNLAEQGLNFQEFARSLINYLRQALILKISGLHNPTAIGFTKEEFQKLQEQANSFEEQELRRLLNLLLEAENKMRYSPIPQLSLELAVIESCEHES